MGKFDDDWKREFKRAVSERSDGQKIISSANSLVTNRHLLAHGKTPTASFGDIYQYYQDALELVNEIDAVVK